MSDLQLVGGGSHAGACIDLRLAEGDWDCRGTLEQAGRQALSPLGHPGLGTDPYLEQPLDAASPMFNSPGQLTPPAARKAVLDRANKGRSSFLIVQLSHAYVSSMAVEGLGSIVMHQLTANTRARIGKQWNAISQTLIEHDYMLGDFCHLFTGAFTYRRASFGEACFIENGAIRREGVNTGDGVVAGAGVRVMKDIQSGRVVKGGS